MSLYLHYSGLEIFQYLRNGERQAAQTIRCIDSVIALNRADLSTEHPECLHIGIGIETAQPSQLAEPWATFP